MYAYSWWWFPMWTLIHGLLGFGAAMLILHDEPWESKRSSVLYATAIMMLLWIVVGVEAGQVPWN